MKNSNRFFAFLLAGAVSIPGSFLHAATVTDSDFNGTTNYAQSVTFNLSTAGQTYDYSGVISGTGSSLTKTGAATLAITTNQTFTGATTISGGTLSINDVARLASTSGIALSNGSTLKLASIAGGAISKTITVSGTGTIDYKQQTTNTLNLTLAGDAASTVILAGNNNPSGTGNVSSFLLWGSFSGTVEITGGKLRIENDLTSLKAIRLNGGSIMKNSESNTSESKITTLSTNLELAAGGGSIRAGFGYPLNLTGKISGTGQLGIAGDSGYVCLSNSANDFSGGILIGGAQNGNTNNCKLYLGADNALGTGVVTFGVNADTNLLDLNGHSVTTTAIGGLSSLFANVQVKNSGATASTLTLNVAKDASLTFKGVLSGNTNLVMGGSGTQTLDGAGITYTGTTTVNGGTLEFTSTVGTGATSGFFLNGGTLKFAKDVGFSGANTLFTLNGGAVAFSSESAQTLTNALTVQAGGGTVKWSTGNAANTSALAIRVNGSGTTADTVLNLQGTSNPNGNCSTLHITEMTNFSGKLELSGGKLVVNSATLAGLNHSGFILSGGTLMLNGGVSTVSNSFEIREGTSGSIRAGSSGTYTLTGLISGAGELGISGDNGTTIFANSANSFSGGLKIGVAYNANSTYAYAKMGANDSIGSGVVTIANDTSWLDLAGFSTTGTPIAGLSSTSGNAQVRNSSSTASTLKISVEDGKSYSYAGKITGKINLIKAGAGSQTLTGSGIATTGTVLVQDGTLTLANSKPLTGAVTIGDSTGGAAPKIVLGAANALGTGGVTFGSANAALELAGFSTSVGGLSSSVSGGALGNASGTASTLTLEVGSGKAFTFDGKTTGNIINFVKTGDGKQTLKGTGIAVKGSVTVNGGELALTNLGASSLASAMGFTLAQGTTLSIQTSAGSNLGLTGSLTVKGSGATVGWSTANVSDTTVLNLNTVSGSGTTADTVLTLKGVSNPNGNCITFNVGGIASTFAGRFELAGGKLVVGSASLIPAQGLILSGGTLMINAKTTLAAPIEVKSGTLGTVRAGANTANTLSGKITAVGQFGISGDNGSFTLTNPENDFSGGLLIGSTMNFSTGGNNIATLKAGAENVFQNAVVTMAGSATDSRLDLNGFSQTIRGLNSPSAADTTALVTNSKTASPVTLTLDVASGDSFTYFGALTGSMDLVKTGKGTQTFAGRVTSSNTSYPTTFTGDIQIQDGTFAFTNGDFDLASTSVTLSPTGTLELGDGELTLQGLSMGFGSVLQFDETTDPFTLTASSFNGNSDTYSVSWNGADLLFSQNWAGLFEANGNGAFSLSRNAVPEPSAWLLLGLGLLLFRRRPAAKTL